MMNQKLVTCLAGFLALVGAAAAGELSDVKFGFRLDIPDGFTELEADPSDPATLYKSIDREPAEDDPGHVILIQRLGGVIEVDSRIRGKLPVVEGVETTLQEFSWKGHKQDVIRNVLTLPGGVEYVVYGIQYPLSGEAVQLQVGGPVAEDEKVHARFLQVAGGFKNTKPLYSAGPPAGRELSGIERTERIVTGIGKLVATALVLALLPIWLMRRFSKKRRSESAR
jgi:hypothetical protein